MAFFETVQSGGSYTQINDYQIFYNGTTLTYTATAQDKAIVLWTQAGQPASNYSVKLNNVTQPWTSKYLTALAYTCGTAIIPVKSGDVLTFTTPTNYAVNAIMLG